jgi:subtilisin family serine protease
MPDHGLFIAGIIHCFVPKARLYLIQVINDWGICSISSIVAGLEKLVEFRAQARRRVPLVINLSLVLGLPREQTHRAAAHSGHGPRWLETFQPAALDDLSVLFEKIANLLSGTPNSIVVAAAGNDGLKPRQNPQNLPRTRYPAAFPKVTGVGALEQITRSPGRPGVSATYAPYSNIADENRPRGFITFGGQIAPGNPPDHATADKTGGMLGIYTGDFPDGTFNTTGLARWAGTSFATPVITGLIAKLLCTNPALRPGDAEDDLRQLVVEAATADADVVPIIQPL